MPGMYLSSSYAPNVTVSVDLMEGGYSLFIRTGSELAGSTFQLPGLSRQDLYQIIGVCDQALQGTPALDDKRPDPVAAIEANPTAANPPAIVPTAYPDRPRNLSL